MTALTHRDYKIGWICALHMELAAAIAMLDARHESLPRDPYDDNSYVLGRIAEHNIAIASLPDGEIGTNSAAHVATQMRLSFKSIRFGLMVGIGGGVPSREHDIRLGDIVVSRPSNQNGGLIQYDFGKTKPGKFERSGFLNSPPTALRTAVTNLRADHRFPGHSKILSYLLPNNPNLPPEFARPEVDDELFKPEYVHVNHRETCSDCDRRNLVIRHARDSNPVIHYGTIASANQVMRDAIVRDQHSVQDDVLCFEMEAAGLMNHFPCIVIRGICDYADSHKNKRWQDYAAATAAAYAKELLRFISAEQITQMITVSSTLV
jgi:nucleoside phosphorylase